MRTALACLLAFAAIPPLFAVDKAGVEFAVHDGVPLRLDLHIPEGPGPFPAAILVHGGGFDEGTRTSFISPLFPVLSGAQFGWFTIDYRLAPKAHLEEAAQDVRDAIAFVRSHSQEYHLAPGKLALIGESAGGFLVNYVGTRETKDSKVDAVVDFYGPSDYAKLAQTRLAHPELFNMSSVNRHAQHGGGIGFFGVSKLDQAGLERLRSVSPIHAVHRGMPPFLCIHGTKDDQVLYEQTTDFCDAVRKAGSACTVITVQNGGHGMSSWRDPAMQGWKTEMVSWLEKTLKNARH